MLAVEVREPRWDGWMGDGREDWTDGVGRWSDVCVSHGLID